MEKPVNARQMSLRAAICAAALVPCTFNTVSAEVTFEWVTVGNPGNAADPLNAATIPGIGAVAYEYAIARNEVTNAQYAEFLSAVAVTDPNGLYNGLMGTDPRGGITQSGTSGSFTYGLRFAMGNKPVNFVSYLDAMRFVNWLHNGQPTGVQDATTTEDGVYAISDGLSETRATNAKYFIPDENEWYKAAFHQSAAHGGDADDYWLYPTATNDIPTAATADFEGDISNPGVNVVNYNLTANWNGIFGGHVTTVGSAGIPSRSYYGTSDQGGNLLEWVETTINGNRHIVRGSAFNWSDFNLQSTGRLTGDPVWEFDNQGFRVASTPPTCSPVAINNGDGDADGFVDLVDFGRLTRCLSGPDVASEDCGCFDIDGDSDVDLRDAGTMARAFATAPVGCVIDGRFYEAGQTADGLACIICNPKINETDWTVLASGTACRAADAAFPCDQPEVCDGVNLFCPLPETGRCENGASCGADDHCLSGSCNGGTCGEGKALIRGACDSDPDCADGWVCDGGICLGALSSFCVFPDQCATGLACDLTGSGRCKNPTGDACTVDTDCFANATCDPTRHECVLNVNELCSTDDECGSGLCSCGAYVVAVCPKGQPNCTSVKCLPQGVCRTPLGEPCTQLNDCALSFADGDVVSEGRCLNGFCEPGLLQLGAICETNPQGGFARCVGGANDDQYCTSIADCPDGSCVAGPGQGPRLGDSPNDELCGTQKCFKAAGGQLGPCTPAAICNDATTGGLAGTRCLRDVDCPGVCDTTGDPCNENDECGVCDNSDAWCAIDDHCPGGSCIRGTCSGACLNKCGNAGNPPDYKCCRGDNGVCSTDFDCCGTFLNQAKGCKSDGRCGTLSGTGGLCTTTLDCVRRGELECLDGFCGGPPQPPQLAAGDECNPSPDTNCTDGSCDGVCGAGLQCINCEAEGRGFRCADAQSPCCNSGGVDEFWCGSSSYPDPYNPDLDPLRLPNLCCGYTCVPHDDDQHCGRCDIDCTADPGLNCIHVASGVCELGASDDFGCVRTWESTGVCVDSNPDDHWLVRCEEREVSASFPLGYTCINYEDQQECLGCIPWGGFCISGTIEGRVCTVDDHCEDFCGEVPGCVCGSPDGGYNALFNLEASRVCGCP